MTKELLAKLFSTDKDLLEKYHLLAPNSAEVCAEKTMEDLEASKCKIHLIKHNNEVIGYYGIEGTAFLTGFFLTPEHRNKSTIDLFWKIVDAEFNKDYFVGLYKKNTRAIDFMNKKTDIKYDTKDTVLFKVRR